MTLSTIARGAFRSRITTVVLAAALASLSLSTLSAVSANAAQGPTLVVYSAQGYDSAVVKAYNATHPGFPVTLNDNSTGPLLQQIQAEGNHPKWGVLWVDGATAFAALDLKHMLVKNSVPAVSFNALGKANIPADRSFTPASMTVTGALCYDSAQISADQLPSTWAQLSQPRFQGMLGMNDPSQSGPTYPMIAGAMDYLGKYKKGPTSHAVNAGKSLFQGLYNNGVLINATNGPTIGAMQSQQIKMALIQSSACYGSVLNGSFPTLKVKYLNFSVALPGVIGIDAKTPPAVQAEARKFVAYVMSPAGQHVMKTGDPQGDSLFWPTLNGEKPANPIIPSLASTHAITINPYVWGPLESSINSWFDNSIANNG
ncbi:MAG TPA: extracellular solute-binding protein [Acidimicrobiales bacterium]|nr:extracellular solute-binding protein [Acidimicrobiales bacterium]